MRGSPSPGDRRSTGPRHVLLIHQLFITTGQAGGTRHFELARHWLEQGARVTVIAGHRSYLTGAPHAEEVALPEGLTVLRIGTLPFDGGGLPVRIANFLAFMVRALIQALRVPEVDVVVGTSPPLPQAGAAAVAARLRGVPFVLEIRDLWPDFAVALGVLRSPFLIWAARALERWLYRAADRIVVNSPGFVSHVQARARGPVTVVPNGVDCSAFQPAERGESFRSRHGLGDDFVVLYAGAHGVPNDLDTVLEAAERSSRDGIRWVLIGDGREKARLQEEARRRSLDQVLFLPPVPKDEIADALAAADLGLAILAPLPLFGTVYPNKVFDYMAAGRPVVLAIDGAIRRVVEGAGAGSFVPPGDPQALSECVARYRSDRAVGRRHGASGRALVESRFRRDTQAEAFLEVLAEAVAEGGSVSALVEAVPPLT